MYYLDGMRCLGFLSHFGLRSMTFLEIYGHINHLYVIFVQWDTRMEIYLVGNIQDIPKSNQIIYDDHTLYIIPFQTHSQMFPASFWGNHCPLPRTLCWTFTLTTDLQSSPGIQVWRHQLRECQGLRPTIRSLDKKMFCTSQGSNGIDLIFRGTTNQDHFSFENPRLGLLDENQELEPHF